MLPRLRHLVAVVDHMRDRLQEPYIQRQRDLDTRYAYLQLHEQRSQEQIATQTYDLL